MPRNNNPRHIVGRHQEYERLAIKSERFRVTGVSAQKPIPFVRVDVNRKRSGDQTALLLLGEGHSRRDYMFHYSGAKLGVVRWVNIKALIEGPGHGGLPGITMCNVVRDPGEKHCSMYPYLWTVSPFQNLVKSHMQTIAKFPHRKSEVTPDGAELTPHD